MRPFNYYSALGLGSLLGLIAAVSGVMVFVFMFIASAMPGSQENLTNLALTCLLLAVSSGFGAWLITSTVQGIGIDTSRAKREVVAEQQRERELRAAQHEVDLLQLKNQSAALLEGYEARALKQRDLS